MTRWGGYVMAYERISTPMPLAGHDKYLSDATHDVRISTPMPLAGHDRACLPFTPCDTNFYSHAPRGA